jgi:hypothetical protein
MHGATGEVCAECGTHHQIVDSIPARPLRVSELDELEESETVALAMPVVAAFGNLAESEEEEETTREIVLSTMNAARILSFEPDHGWVVADEREHEEGDDPVEMGMWLQQKSSMGAFE